MARLRQSIVSRSAGFTTAPVFRSATPERARIDVRPSEDSGVAAYSVVFPFGPSSMDFQNHSGRYNQIQRPGKAPIVVFENKNLRTVTFSAVIAHRPSGGVLPDTVSDILDDLTAASEFGWECDFWYGSVRLPYKCFLTQFSYSVTYRNSRGEPLRAEVQIQLTEKYPFIQNIYELPLIRRTPAGTDIPSNIKPSGGDNFSIADLQFGQDAAELERQAQQIAANAGVTVEQAYVAILGPI